MSGFGEHLRELGESSTQANRFLIRPRKEDKKYECSNSNPNSPVGSQTAAFFVAPAWTAEWTVEGRRDSSGPFRPAWSAWGSAGGPSDRPHSCSRGSRSGCSASCHRRTCRRKNPDRLGRRDADSHNRRTPGSATKRGVNSSVGGENNRDRRPPSGMKFTSKRSRVFVCACRHFAPAFCLI